MYNSILRYTQQIFFPIGLSAMLSLNYAVRVEFETMNIAASVVVLGFFIFFTNFSHSFLQKNKNLLS